MIPCPGSAFLFTHRNLTVWIPFLITPSALPQFLRSHYSTWLFVELCGHIFSSAAILLNIYMAAKVKAFNLNMQILNWYGIAFQSGMNMSTRIVLILIELGYLSLSEVSDYVVPLILLKLTVWVGIYNCVIYTTIERYAALKYSSDYETNQRVSISVSVIVVNTMVSSTVAYLLVYNILNGAVYMLVIFCMSNISCLAFSRVALQNKALNKKVCSFHGDYSVSRRWQVKDNIRMTKDIRILIYGCAAQISLYLPIFFLPPLLLENDPEWVSALELNKATFQLVCSYGFGIAYLFCTLCITRHFDYIKSILWKENYGPKIAPAASERQTTEDHFESLKVWWNSDADKSCIKE